VKSENYYFYLSLQLIPAS